MKTDQLFYSVFNNGFGYSEVHLHFTFEEGVGEIASILMRPENYKQLPVEIRDSLNTWDAIYDNLLDAEAPYRTNWVIEIGSLPLPKALEPRCMFLAFFENGNGRDIEVFTTQKDASARVVEIANLHDISANTLADLINLQEADDFIDDWQADVIPVEVPDPLGLGEYAGSLRLLKTEPREMFISLFRGEETDITIHENEYLANAETLRKAKESDVIATSVEALIDQLRESDPFDGDWDVQVFPIEVPAALGQDSSLMAYLSDPIDLLRTAKLALGITGSRVYELHSYQDFDRVKKGMDEVMYQFSTMYADFTNLYQQFDAHHREVMAVEAACSTKKETVS